MLISINEKLKQTTKLYRTARNSRWEQDSRAAATSATFGVGTGRRVSDCHRDSRRRWLRDALRWACRRARPTSICSRQALVLEEFRVISRDGSNSKQTVKHEEAHNRCGELERGDLFERRAECPYANRAVRPASCNEDALLWCHAASISTTKLIRRLIARRWSFGAFRRWQKREC